MSQELWKRITEYQGHSFSGEWEVSSWGNVRRVSDRKPMPYYSDNRGLGYLRFKMYDTEGVRVAIKVHRLVALNFKTGPDMSVRNLEVNHIDGNTKNNSISNLEWVSHKENMLKLKLSRLKPCSEMQLALNFG